MSSPPGRAQASLRRVGGEDKTGDYTRDGQRNAEFRAVKRVHVDADVVRVGWFESILQQAGIECLVRNRYLGGAIGELPLNEAWPEIWVLDERDADLARRLIAAAATPDAAPTTPWVCAGCSESIEAQFGQCWNCGAERP